MRLTPVEIRQHRFHRRFRGFDSAEVEAFLEEVVSDFEAVVHENAQLRREAERLGRELSGCRGRENTIQSTLTTAQEVVEGLKRTAIKESELIVGESRVQAEKMILEAQERRTELRREVTELRYIRESAELDIRKTLEGYLRLIQSYQEARGAKQSEQTPRPHGP